MMNIQRGRLYLVFTLIALAIPLIQTSTQAEDWLTYYEKSGKLETPRYAETMAYCSKLAAASPKIEFINFGTSPEGRTIPMLIISKDEAFTAAEAHTTGKPIVLIENCIHPGESEGKDASLMFARDLAIYNIFPHLFDRLILLIIPIFNVDGHERFSPYNRINQNGPKEMGWRVTATRLNLNRDFMKVDTPEMRAFMKLFNEWLPHLFIDCHTTNGADHQYALAYNIDTHQEFGGAISEWAKNDFLPAINQTCEQSGLIVGPYAGLIDKKHPEKGLRGGVWPPRLSNAYITLRNRAGLLIETHSLKAYDTRVDATYQFLVAALEELAAHPDKLLLAIQKEDSLCSQMGSAYDPETRFPLRFKSAGTGERLVYRGYRIVEKDGFISGAPYVTYEKTPVDIPTIYFNDVEPSVSVSIPRGYLIPQQWRETIDVLKIHGIKTFRLSERLVDEFECYRFSDATFQAAPYEGRHPVSFTTQPVIEKMIYEAGSVYVPLQQTRAKLIMHLLEPQAPDALIYWGFFNTIFEQKEYFEDYVMEPLAQKMANESLQLRAEFQQKLASDSSFAANARQRLQFFYQRSAYWDPQLNLYPVARVTRPLHADLSFE
ncbi:M14 family metallopeptidase [candidate division KSB1 bacterium]|nr:M14 family metallopeptidase [candidate division KSB1 bacterium]